MLCPLIEVCLIGLLLEVCLIGLLLLVYTESGTVCRTGYLCFFKREQNS